MRTDDVGLMELFVDTFGLEARPAAPADPAAPSLFQAPMPDLAAPGPTLAACLGGEKDLVTALIARWRREGDDDAAQVLARIASHLATTPDAPDSDAPVQARDYVYPVV